VWTGAAAGGESRTRLVLALVSVLIVAIGGCRDRSRERAAPADSRPSSNDAGQPWFDEVAASTGLTFTHFNGMTGEFLYPELMAPGVALFDFDNDGDLDVFIVQGRMLGDKAIAGALFPPRNPSSLRGRLFRNDLAIHADNTRTLHFTDVTVQSAIDARGYGMGVATGDFDNDGCVDLYVTNLGPNQLFRNNCDGTFSDVTTRSGTAGAGWSVSAAFVDFDRDGRLDLFVGHYLNYTVAGNIKCYGLAGEADYCPPHVYTAQPSHLYHNDGDGTFTDVTAAAGIAAEFGPTLGVATGDFNGDGWIDIYVANDGQPNQLWINQRNGTFRNTALLAGAALGADGEAKSSMGVDAGDFDNDGDEDLFITELTGQGVDLYVNNGSGLFEELSARASLRLASLPSTGFGAAWLDFDNDGWLDVLTVNGAVTRNAAPGARPTAWSLQQRKQLFRNTGRGRFEDVSDRAGAIFQAQDVSRGAAFGDIDNDGDIDVVVGNDSGPPHLLVNNVGQRAHWIGVRVVGQQTRRDMVGARVAVVRPDGSTLWRRSRSDGSYASANDPRVLAGLGDSTKPPTIRVQWPDGKIEEWRVVTIDRYTTLSEGAGTPVAGAIR
jgi:hypothetical protein